MSNKKDDKNSFWSKAIEQKIPVLINGLHSVDTTETPYPSHEHTGLLDSKGNVVSTPLTAVLSARTEVIPKSLNEKDLILANTMKKNALSLTYRGTPSQPINKIEWETIHKQLEPLCVQHVKLCLATNKTTLGYLNRILVPSRSFQGDFNTSSKRQMELQTKSFCLDMLADAPYECADNEADVIEAFVAAEESIDISSVSARNRLTPEQKQLMQSRGVSYKKGLATLRGMINHTYLRTIMQLSNKPAKRYITSVHVDFLQHQQENDDDSDITFTAKYLCENIKNKCLNDNEDTAEAARKELSEMVRQVPDKPLTWLKSFTPMIAALAHALGETVLNDTDTKKWKTHFVRQLTMKEKEKISAHKESYLVTSDTTATDTAAVESIKEYLHGTFNTKNFKTVLQGLNDSLPPFAPDPSVKEYMSHYARNKKWKHKVDFNAAMNSGLRNKDKSEKRRKPDSNGKKRHKEKNKHEGNKSRHSDKKFISSSSVSKQLQCRRQQCIDKGVNTTHKHEDCYHKHKQPQQPKNFPNLGKAPAKKAHVKAGRRTVTRKPEKVPCWSCKKIGCDKHQCYICGKNHPKRDCPDKPKVYDRLAHSKTFNTLMNEVFEPRLRDCAQEIVNTWGDLVCPKCHGTTCKINKCRSKDKLHRQNMKETKKLYAHNSKIMEILEKAHHDPFHTNQMPTMNSAFLASTEGQEDSDDESDQGHEIHDSDPESWTFHMSEKVQEENHSSSDGSEYNNKRRLSVDTDDSQIETSFSHYTGDSKHKRRKQDSTSGYSDDNSGNESEMGSPQGDYSDEGSPYDTE